MNGSEDDSDVSNLNDANILSHPNVTTDRGSRKKTSKLSPTATPFTSKSSREDEINNSQVKNDEPITIKKDSASYELSI